MGFQKVLNTLSTESKRSHAALILVGGWALGHYGVSRQTLDIDFMLRPEDLPKVGDMLRNCGYEMVYKTRLLAKYRSAASDLPDVDLLVIEAQTLNQILRESSLATFGRAKFSIPSLNHLIAMKLHAIKVNAKNRWSKDFPDIIALIEANCINVKSDEFRALCLKYATRDIHGQIIERIT